MRRAEVGADGIAGFCPETGRKKLAAGTLISLHLARKKAIIGRLLDADGDLVGIFRLIRI